jgi:hypothetical protein
MNSALNYGFDCVETNYTMAREILETSGSPRSTTHPWLYWECDRLKISGSLGNAMLRVEFCCGNPSGFEDWRLVLNTSSFGGIEFLSNPSISELDAGEGDSEENFIPWYMFLTRAHRELFGEDNNAGS